MRHDAIKAALEAPGEAPVVLVAERRTAPIPRPRHFSVTGSNLCHRGRRPGRSGEVRRRSPNGRGHADQPNTGAFDPRRGGDCGRVHAAGAYFYATARTSTPLGRCGPASRRRAMHSPSQNVLHAAWGRRAGRGRWRVAARPVHAGTVCGRGFAARDTELRGTPPYPLLAKGWNPGARTSPSGPCPSDHCAFHGHMVIRAADAYM